MDLRTYLGAIRKSWWLVLILSVLGLAGGAAYASKQTPVYAAHISFYVSTPSASSADVFSNGQFAEGRAISYAELLSSDRTAQMIVSSAHLDISPAQVAREISGAADLNTVLVRATIKDVSRGRALTIATALGERMPQMVDQLDNTPKTSSVVLSVVSGPSVEHAPVSPRKLLDAALGLVVGLLIGLVLAVLREVLNTSLRSVESVQEVSGAPVLASIPFDRRMSKTPLVVAEASYSIRAEAFRQLRTNLQFIDAARPGEVVAITSSVASEGKSATTVNLGVLIAESGRRVLVIEGDLRRPHVCEYFGLERAVGLSNVLAGQIAVSEVIQTWAPDNLDVLASGTIPPNPSELLGGPTMVALIAELRGRYDTILIDTPPLLPVTDAAIVGALSDGVVIVVRYGKTSRSQLATATELLSSVGARILGGVLNMKPGRRFAKRTFGYYQQPADAAVSAPKVSSVGSQVGKRDDPVEKGRRAAAHSLQVSVEKPSDGETRSATTWTKT